LPYRRYPEPAPEQGLLCAVAGERERAQLGCLGQLAQRLLA
jgi:hypothetical protein